MRGQKIELAYDYLVLATGSIHSYFGHQEWERVAPGLKRIEDATAIRTRILLAFEDAEIAPEEDQRALLTFAIVGAGPTGVEMAGAIAEIARQTLASDFRTIDPRLSRVVLIEAGPRILPSFPEDLSKYAADTQLRMGVEVLTSTKVTNCDAEGVSLDRDWLAADPPQSDECQSVCDCRGRCEHISARRIGRRCSGAFVCRKEHQHADRDRNHQNNIRTADVLV